MRTLGLVLFLAPALLFGYAYAGYPALLWLLTRGRRRPPLTDPPTWPELTIIVPIYNEERSIAETLESILTLDYPPERRHILVISDHSTDRSDEIVRGFADRGVRLIRMGKRSGKTAAENAAGAGLRGSVVVNTDATIRVQSGAIKALARALHDPAVGVASGRDISTGLGVGGANTDESSYVSYEMWLRDLETDFHSIVGASGCFFAIRRDLFDSIFPEALSRDFASPMIARAHGFRSVSVPDAICLVPRTRSLRAEFRRKVRTMTRGLETLWYMRHLMNPFTYGRFAMMLVSHKLVRWLVFAMAPVGIIGLVILSAYAGWARWLLAVTIVLIAVGAAGYYQAESKRLPRVVSALAFLVSGHVAGAVAWFRACRGELDPVWEPTRRH